ncbi:MAG: hypothetical protein K5917_08280 [Clostridiales bacterium]|nr:hypothetical protein [Clostridiales bacterium]
MLYGAYITKNGGAYTIGNSFISRTFYVDDSKRLKTAKIINFRTATPTEIVPQVCYEFVVNFIKKKSISSADLKVKVIQESVCNGFDKCIEIIFEPYNFKGAVFSFKELIVINKDDHFMRKRVFIYIDKANREKFNIDYIDLEHFVLADNTLMNSWTHPEGNRKDIAEFNRFLGQPIYLDSVFVGSEFPATDNRIENRTAFIRYYSGKNFEELETNENGLYCAWNTVIGACANNDDDTRCNDFIAYIRTIQLPRSFRLQYNSWFDKKKEISEENLTKTFFEMEKGLSQNGVEPLQSFVIEKGWHDVEGSFWNFNSSFANGFPKLNEISRLMNIPLGLWIGVSGEDYEFAKRVEMGGKGFVNKKAKEVCSLNEIYRKNFIDFMSECLKRYNINSIKLDNFPSRPCESKNHRHIIGGYNDMYFTTDFWEKWLGIISELRNMKKAEEKELWVTVKNNAMVSPWLLQWVNTVWIQNTENIDFCYKNNKKKELGSSDADALMTYRDDRYYNFLITRQVQFPVSETYFFDPIYGKKAGFKMNTANFRKYMYMTAVKGSAFWEMSYSPSMLNEEKWEINAQVISWAKANQKILENSKMIGGIPSYGEVYGYSAWKGTEGIVALRNPSDFSQDFVLNINSSIGVSNDAIDLIKTSILPFNTENDENKYKYGDSITLTLEPHDVFVFKFSKNAERTPRIIWEKTADEQSIIIAFDRPVIANAENYLINGVPAMDCFASADYCKIRMRAKDKFEVGQDIEVKIQNASDLRGNKINSILKLTYNEKDVVFDFVNNGEIVLGDKTLEKSFTTDNDFSICVQFNETQSNKLIVYQGNEYYVSIDTEGKLRFYAKELGAVSRSLVNTGESICATLVCERNGMLKIYINGKLDAVAYRSGVECPVIEPLPITANFCVEAFKIVNRAYAYDEVPDFLFKKEPELPEYQPKTEQVTDNNTEENRVENDVQQNEAVNEENMMSENENS